MDSEIGLPALRSLSIIMINDDGLLERSRCELILRRSSSGSFLLSRTSASLQADGASSLYFFAAFSTSGLGVRIPRKVPSDIHRMLTMSKSAGFLAPLRISYMAAMSSS